MSWNMHYHDKVQGHAENWDIIQAVGMLYTGLKCYTDKTSCNMHGMILEYSMHVPCTVQAYSMHACFVIQL